MASLSPARALIVIPARHGSSRFPGKPLQPLAGANGFAKPLIARSVEAARGAAPEAAIVVATASEWDPVELNNPSDVAVIEAILKARGID